MAGHTGDSSDGDSSDKSPPGRAGSSTDDGPSLEEPLLLRVIGPCTVTIHTTGAASNSPFRKLSGIHRRILSYLALVQPGSANVEELLNVVWGENPPATAQTSLYNHISRLRTQLGEDVILTLGNRYQLGMPTDVEELVHKLESGEKALRADDFAEASDYFDEAISLWRGTPYAEIDDTVPVESYRRRIIEILRSVETLRLEAALGSGRAAWAVPEAERLVGATPGDEHRWVLLISALDMAGRRGDALGACDRAKVALSDGFGLGPSEALVMAESELLRSDPTETVEHLGRFIGRDDLIHETVRHLLSGQSVVLAGEPGIGKTRLLEELERVLRRRNVRVAEARCSRQPAAPLATLYDLAASLSTDLIVSIDPVTAFRNVARNAADTFGIVVLAVDDADLAGPTTVDALLRAADIEGVVLLATSTEPDLVESGMGAGESLYGSPATEPVTLDVGPLNPTELAQFARSVLDAGDRSQVDDERVDWLVEMSGGNPSLLQHLFDDPHWVDAQRPSPPVLLSDDGNNEAFPTIDAVFGASDPGDFPSLAHLRAVVRHRVDRLGLKTRAALQAAAVCASYAPRTLIEELSSVEGVAAAIAAGLVDESLTAKGTAVVRFRHGAVRQTVYDDLPPGRRIELHYRAASVLGATHAPLPIVAAHASVAAELDPAAAATACVAAANYARSEGACAEAGAWFDRACDAIERGGLPESIRVGALIGRADALRCSGATTQEDAVFDAVDAAFALGDQTLIASAIFAMLQLGSTTQSGAYHHKAIEAAERALGIVTDGDNLALVAGSASLAYSMSEKAERSRELFLQAESLAQSKLTRRQILPFAYLGLGHPQDLGLRTRLTDELLELSAESGDPIARFEALQMSYSVGLQTCDGLRARDALSHSEALMEDIGDIGRRWSLIYQKAAIAHLDADLEGSEQLAGQAMELFSVSSPSRAFAAYGGQILIIRMHQGRLGELVETLEGLVQSQPGAPAWNAALALALAPTDAGRAGDYVRRALEDVPEDFTWMAAHVIGGRAAAIIGDPESCRAYIDRLEPYSGQGCWQGTCSYGPVDSVLYLLHNSLGEDTPAQRYRTAARRSVETLIAPVFEAELG